MKILTENRRRGMIWADWLVIASFVLLIAAHSTTNFLLKYYENSAQYMEDVKQVANLMEANPVAQLFFQFTNLKLIYQFVLMPVWFFGMYYYFRRKLINVNYEMLETIAMMTFMIALLDASNDVSIMLGLLMK